MIMYSIYLKQEMRATPATSYHVIYAIQSSFLVYLNNFNFDQVKEKHFACTKVRTK